MIWERVSFWDVLERGKTGERVDEQDFDMHIFQKAQELVGRYKIKYDPENPVPTDDNLADAVFAAGIDFYAEVGTYLLDTRRVIKFTRQEIEDAIDHATSEFIMGSGNDAVKVVHLDMGGTPEPMVCAGIQTVMFSDEETMFKVYKAMAQDRCVDGLWGGIVLKLEGKYEVVAGTPLEIWAYRKSTEIMRKAVAAAGRPGMVIIQNAPSVGATIACFDREYGMRPTDLLQTLSISDLKVTYDDLNRAGWALFHGAPLMASHTGTIGGFSGSVEGAAIVGIAAGLQDLMVNRGDVIKSEGMPFRSMSRAARESVWVSALILQAFCRNTHFVLDGSIGDHPAAGPGTKQYLYESAAGMITSTACGAHSTAGTRKYQIGRTLNYGTPLESRWMGELCKGAIGIDRETANKIVRYLLPKYEPHILDAPQGKTLEQLYDLDKMEPKPEYLKIYEEVKQELVQFGVKFR